MNVFKANVFLREDGFVNAVEILSDSVRSIGSQEMETICDLYIDGTKSVKPGTLTSSIAGSNRFSLYGSDFGHRNEAISMSERKDESGGVDIGLCLKKCEMDIFLSMKFCCVCH
ncbi:hypothetical protein CARUB_v10018390mg [Capsella rubella]|uniref:Uncharacterized protein n=1 Tax=Capsella rubella TaxID=81985 RepID=R0FR88_9BRAS|nr:hypothetical protein CARUB_v10018390mg [Capsella rubella]